MIECSNLRRKETCPTDRIIRLNLLYYDYINYNMTNFMFVNRKFELSVLEERYSKSKAELFIIYGRRRVGKTELIKHFIRGRENIYYMADLRSEREQLEVLSSLLSEHYKDDLLKLNSLSSWEQFFIYLQTKLNGKKRFILVFDEFQYLAEVSPSLPSLIQKYWDQSLKNRNFFLILCGSSMSFMEKEVLSYKSPLYGRRTGQLEIFQFSFFQLSEMFPKLDNLNLINIFSVFGGVPAYLERVNPTKSLWDNIREEILPRDRILHNEVQFLLMQEMRTPKNYFMILRALALGRTKINDIVQLTGLERGLVGKFLDNLMQLRIVERRVPVNENPRESRKGIYIISDNLFRFWFRFIYPYITYLEEGRYEYVMQNIKKDFGSLVGPVFENVCIQYLKLNPELLPQGITKLGAYWNRQIEIDIVGTDETGIASLFCECKFSTKKVGTDILEELQKKAELSGISSEQKKFILFSKSGFTDSLKSSVKGKDIVLVDINFNKF